MCGELSDPFSISNGIKQGCVLAPTLFGLFFAAVLQDATSDLKSGVFLQMRADGGLLNLARLRAKIKVRDIVAHELQFADDCALVAHSLEDLQEITSHFASAAKSFGLTISLKKMEVLYQLAPGSSYEEPTVLIDDTRLNAVNKFCYLGSIITSSASLDVEIESRTRKACFAFGQLKDRVWSQNIRLATKCKVYRAVVISTLLYGCETWCPYQRHLRQLDQLQQRHLRSLMKITWRDKVSNTEVLSRAGMPAVSTLVMSAQLRWAGHVVRMPDGRLPKDILYGQLSSGTRKRGGQRLRYKDVLHRSLKKADIAPSTWEDLAQDRSQWRDAIRKGVDAAENKLNEATEERHRKRHNRASAPAAPPGLTCQVCGKQCLSRIGLYSHSRTHISNPTN